MKGLVTGALVVLLLATGCGEGSGSSGTDAGTPTDRFVSSVLERYPKYEDQQANLVSLGNSVCRYLGRNPGFPVSVMKSQLGVGMDPAATDFIVDEAVKKLCPEYKSLL